VSYPKKLLKLRPARGIASDTPAHEVGPDFWTHGRNVQMRKGFAARVFGSRDVYGTLPVDVLHMLNARISTTNFWLMFGADEIHALETSNSDDVTPAGGLTAVSQPWQIASTLLNGVPCFTNGLDAPHYWAGNPVTPFVELPDWPSGSRCASIVAFKFHLFALSMTESGGDFPAKIMWSAAAEPGTVPSSWTPAADNEAGDAPLAETPGPTLMGIPLRGSLLVYKRSSTYVVDYIGGSSDEIFSVRPLFTSSGVLTRRGGCDINGQHFLVTDGDIILTDGTNRRSVAQGRMKEALFSQLDQDNYENLFVNYHRAKNEAWVCFPVAGSQYCTKALVYDVSNDAFGERDLDDVTCAANGIVNDQAISEDWDDDLGDWDDDGSYWNAQNFSFATESIVLGHGTAATMQDTDDAVSLAATLGKYSMDFGDGARLKFVKRVHLRKPVGSGTLFVRVGSQMATDSAINWGPEIEVPEGENIANATCDQGRFISLEVRSEDAEVFTLTGVDIEAELRGYF
jgi:hypothetical protein